jgi:hypothetical protein
MQGTNVLYANFVLAQKCINSTLEILYRNIFVNIKELVVKIVDKILFYEILNTEHYCTIGSLWKILIASWCPV